MFKNIVAPNDDYNYILNASLLMKYIQKAQVDTELLEKYINTILGYLNTSLVSYIDRAEVLEKLREKRAQIKFPRNLTPKIPTMRFFQRKSSEIRPGFFIERDNMITEYINDVKSGKITLPANADKNFIISGLQDLLGTKSMINTPDLKNKNPDISALNSTINAIKIKERQLWTQLKYPDIEKPIKEIIKNKIKDLVVSRIDNQLLSQREANVLRSYVNNIEKPEYFRNLTNSEKTIVDPYRRYFNLLVQNRVDVLPGLLYKKKSNFEQETPIKNKIRDKIINIEKGRLRKLMTEYKDYAPILDILINNYNTIVNMSMKDIKVIDIDKISGFYTDDEMMIKLGQKELYYRLNDIINKNYQNLTFYSNASQERLVNRL